MARARGLPSAQRRALAALRHAAAGEGLYLAGGTAIALHLRHRVSRDLDLFGRPEDVDLDRLRAALARAPGVTVVSMTEATLHVRWRTTDVDVVRYPYPLLRKPVAGPEGIAVASLLDLAVMKLAAIAKRGLRRDFWDLHAIVGDGGVTLDEALDGYRRKFARSESDLYHVLRALTFFDEAERDPIVPVGMTPASWRRIRTYFEREAPAALARRAR